MTNNKKKKTKTEILHPWHKQKCVCGHLIYWTTRFGYRCHCSNPKPFNKQK